MNDIAKSLSYLVKTNNGMFKSEAQASFLKSKLDKGTLIDIGSTYGNPYVITYFCDDKGVTKVEKHGTKSGKSEITWERKVEGKTSAQDEKEIKRIKRLIKQAEKSIASRQSSWESGEYNANIDLYHQSMKRDQESLATLNKMLADLV